MVNLYQDKAGGLYLHREKDSEVWEGLERVPIDPHSRFEKDSQQLEAGSDPAWGTLTVLDRDQFSFSTYERVAVYEFGRVRVEGEPGENARAYLGIHAPKNKPRRRRP
jgi:hypothetical protein